MKKIAKLLKADINATSDLAEIAKMLQGKGRGRDTILAHITPREAEILKAAGGSGSTNPETGLLEFQEVDTYDIGFGPDTYAPTDVSPTSVGPSPSNAQIEAQISPLTRDQISQAEDISFAPQVSQAPTGQTFPTGGAIQGTVFSPTGEAYTPRDLARLSVGKEALTQQIEPTSPPPEKTDFLSRLTKGLTSQDMIRLGLAGALAPVGVIQARKGAKQAEAAAAEQRAIGAPYQARGQELVRAAESGELTPTSQQALQATQARLAQGVESRGGVGAQQAAAQLETLRQQLLQNQYNFGLQVANIGDQYALGAIRTGLQADQALSQASMNFYTQLAAIAGGLPLASRTTTQTQG